MKGKKRTILGCLFILICTMMMTMPVSAASAKLNKTKASVVVGKTVQLSVKNTSKKVTWSSSKKSVASVSKKGLVKAKKPGTTTIKAKVGKKTLKCKVTVKANTFSVSQKPWSNVSYCDNSSLYMVRGQIVDLYYDSKGILHADVRFKNFTPGYDYHLEYTDITLRLNNKNGKTIAKGAFYIDDILSPNEEKTYTLDFNNGTKRVVNLNKYSSIYSSISTN